MVDLRLELVQIPVSDVDREGLLHREGGLLDRMEARGLLTRVTCPTDRRSYHVQLTEAGGEMLERMWPVYARGIGEDFLPALGRDPGEVRQMLETIAATCEVARGAEAVASR